jgi:PAS domain S-box-containing protein
MAKILVVDDEKSIRVTLREFLMDANYEVGLAEDADQALDTLARDEFDVVLADIIMPRVTGVALLGVIKRTSPQVQVILMTGEPTVETASEAMRAGAFDYLPKPVRKERLLRTVGNAAGVKALDDERQRLTEENQQHQENLERLVEERTAALRKIHKRMELALAGAGLGAWDWNIRTGEMIVDQRWAEMLGYTLAEIEPHLSAWKRLIYPDDLARVEEALDAHLEGETDCCETEFCLLHKSGKRVWVLSRGRVIERDTNGEPLRACGTNLDISERKRAEEQRLELEAKLRQSQKMEAVGQLASGIAHDFNNILTTILGNVDVSIDEVRRRLGADHDAVRSLEEIEKAGMQASELTRQLLTFGRRDVMQPKAVDLNQILSGLDKMLRHFITENIELKTAIDPELRWVRADTGQLEQIIVNLVINAADAMPDGGTLTLETQNVTLDKNYASSRADVVPGPHVMLAVSDTGHGMDAITRDRIFEPFFTTKPVDKGTGMGLATVHGIVKQSGAHISLYSEPGLGTTFKIYLPAIESTLANPAAILQPNVFSCGHETVLLCEDDRPVRELIARLLRAAGYTVMAADSAQEAVETAQVHADSIDLLMTDVIMPDMSGSVLSQRLLDTIPDLQTLFISGYTASAIAHHGVLDEGVEFLTKPFTRQALLTKVRTVLGQARQES